MRERLNAIKDLRLSQSPPMRQEDLGRLLGVDRAEVSRYENGLIQPTLKRALQIARVFHLPVERVFYGLGELVDAEVVERSVEHPTRAS